MIDVDVKQYRALASADERRLRPHDLVQTVRFTTRLAWDADPRRLVGVTTWELVSSLGLAAVLLVLRGALSTGLDSSHGTQLTPMLGGLVIAGGIRLASTIGGLMVHAQQRVLTVKMTALATDRVAAAACAQELRRFEDPPFHDHVEQATWAAQDYLGMAVLLVVTTLTTTFSLLSVGAALVVMAWWLLPALVLAAAPALRIALARQRGDFTLRMALMENRRTGRYLTQLLTGRSSANEVRAFQLAGPLRARLSANYP